MWKKDGHRERKLFPKLFFLIVSLLIFCLLFVGYYFYSGRFKSSFISPLAKEESFSTEKVNELLKKNSISFSSVVFINDSFLVSLSSGEEVILSSQKNLEQQISSLQVILSRFTIEGKKFSRLDFRYDKPLVTFR